MNPYRTSYDSILFPVDDTDAAFQAAPFVARIARRLEAAVEVHLNRRDLNLDRDAAQVAVDEIARAVGRDGVSARGTVAATARDTDGVRQAVEDDDHDLIILVSDGKPSLLERLLGDRTRELLSDSPRDLLCVQPAHLETAKDINRIIVPVNYQEESVASVGRALSWSTDGTRIQLHYDVPSTFPFLHTARGVKSDHSVDADKVDEVWREELSTFWAEHGDSSLEVDFSRGDGNWTESTIDAAEDSGGGLIVATSSGEGRMGFAERLAMEPTPCPVLMVEPAVDREQIEPPMSAFDSAGWVEDVNTFWFGSLDDAGVAAEETSARWWKADPNFDRRIQERFGELHEAAARGDLDIGDDPRERLAALIVLDQFSRNMKRGSAAMYANDDAALQIARKMTREGQDKELPAAMRAFCYLPFMHSENLEDQDYCVALFEVAAYETSGRAEEAMRQNLDFAKRHRDQIATFGRFPHRNALLGRANTAEEQRHLDTGGETF